MKRNIIMFGQGVPGTSPCTQLRMLTRHLCKRIRNKKLIPKGFWRYANSRLTHSTLIISYPLVAILDLCIHVAI